jgi:hypothetical protein
MNAALKTGRIISCEAMDGCLIPVVCGGFRFNFYIKEVPGISREPLFT